jgi:hypothetical protein
MRLRRTVNTKPKSGWITDDEENKGNTSEEEMSDHDSKATREKSSAWWKKVILSLPRMNVRSEQMPRIGEQCLVMKGKAGDDRSGRCSDRPETMHGQNSVSGAERRYSAKIEASRNADLCEERRDNHARPERHHVGATGKEIFRGTEIELLN